MSNISDAYVAIKAYVQNILPTHQLLPNPYNLQQNPMIYLDQGVGIAFGPAENRESNMDCLVSLRRTVTISVTRKFNATNLNRTNKEDSEKLLLEDLYLLINEVQKYPQIDAYGPVTEFSYTDDGGIEQVFDERQDYIVLRCNFDLIYYEKNN